MSFDVFLCHNSRDKPAVKEIARRLAERGISPWLDEWELRPGEPWQPALEKQIREIRAAAVFVGSDGAGPWQDLEIAAFLRQFVKRSCPVIPVILPDCREPPELPVFLEGMTWVDFRRRDPDPLARLIWGITGERPEAAPAPAAGPEAPRTTAADRWRLPRRAGALAAALILAAFVLWTVSDRLFGPSGAGGEAVGGQVVLWRLAEGAVREVTPDQVFRSGDRLRFAVTPSHDGRLFVLHRSPGGTLEELWPRNDGAAVAAGATVLVPPSPGALGLDDEPGEELFYLALVAGPAAGNKGESLARVRETIGRRFADAAGAAGRGTGWASDPSLALVAGEDDPTIAVVQIRLWHAASAVVPPRDAAGQKEDER